MEYSEYTSNDESVVTQSYDEVLGFVTDLYSRLDYDFGQDNDGAMLASASDEAQFAYSSNSINDFTNGAWSALNPHGQIWEDSYAAIQASNYYLDNYSSLTFEELRYNADYAGRMFSYENSLLEARFLRAYFYFNLVRAYGDIPYFTRTLSPAEATSVSQMDAATVFDNIIGELEDIAPLIVRDYTKLPTRLSAGAAQNGRANRLAVLALRGRAALYAASPLFNPTDDIQKWRRAALANLAVIDSASVLGKKLTKYANLTAANNYSNSEVIFARRYWVDNVNTSNILETNNFPVGVEGGHGGNCPSANLVDAYETIKGLSIGDPNSGYDANDPYANRDPRLGMTIVKNGDTKWPSANAYEIETYEGGRNGLPQAGATPTGYYLRKWLNSSVDLSATSTNRATIHTWITFRLGEFYLNYAEAVLHVLGSADATSEEFPLSAREAVNVIRRRSDVGMPDLPIGLDASTFEARLRNERFVELAFEGHRFWDLRRWRDTEKLQSIGQTHILRSDDGSLTYRRVESARFWDDKQLLFPIPQTEIQKNGNLRQNAGW